MSDQGETADSGDRASTLTPTARIQEERRGSLNPLPTLFPLGQLLPLLLEQEGVLWQRNEGILNTLRAGPGSFRDNSLINGDRISLRSVPTSPSTTPVSTEEDQPNIYFIRYSKLADVIHRYFRKLEKRHACLHLTGRKARHENLRHVDVHRTSSSEDDPVEVTSAGAFANDEGRPLTVLKDEELLVYRSSLMCSQFPMLSAPSPPEGQSPTPTPPSFPIYLGSVGALDLSRTAPAEFLATAATAAGLTGDPKRSNPSGPQPPPGSTQPSGSLPRVGEPGRGVSTSSSKDKGGTRQPASEGRRRQSSTTREADKTNPSLEPSEVKRKPLPSNEEPELQSLWPSGPRPPASQPIPISGGGRSKVKGSGVWSTRENSRKDRRAGLKQGKRLSSEGVLVPSAAATLSGEEEEEEELVELASSKPSSVRSEAGNPLAREHPFTPMVNREMLASLVRQSFHQTEEQQLQFEQILRHEYGRRSKGEILAKELAAQLQVLENNAHPFYKPKLFVTRNGYDMWLQAEKHRVRSLIDKFWHFSLPRPQLWRHYNPTDYHRAYIILLQKIICCESRTQRREPVHAGRTPSSPLSPTAQRLLTEFGLRYGVGELYRRIVYLDYLAKHFDYEIWYIKHCTEQLRSIRSLLPRNRNKITAVRREMELLRAAVHLLHSQADNSLTRIDRLFLDSDPREGVYSLIELLAELLDAEQSLFGKKVRPVEDWLKRYLKAGFVLRYERRKEIAADETLQKRTAQPFVLTSALVNALLLSIRDEVHEYKEKFQVVFRPHFSIVPFAKEEFYRLLCADACSLCARMIHRPETRQSLSLEMLGLMYRMNERDIEWESVITPEMQLWRSHFVDLALIWMEVLGKQINQWILTAVARDQWTMLTFSTIHSSEGSTSSGHVTAGVRPSPFPSPSNTPFDRNGSAFIPGSLGTTGAFMPYQRVLLKRVSEKPSSETSGAVTDISSNASTTSVDSSTGPIGEIPEVMLNGARTREKTPAGDSILHFGQESRGDPEDPHQEEMTLSGAVEFPHEIETSISVYAGYEPYVPDRKPGSREASKSPQEGGRDEGAIVLEKGINEHSKGSGSNSSERERDSTSAEKSNYGTPDEQSNYDTTSEHSIGDHTHDEPTTDGHLTPDKAESSTHSHDEGSSVTRDERETTLSANGSSGENRALRSESDTTQQFEEDRSSHLPSDSQDTTPAVVNTFGDVTVSEVHDHESANGHTDVSTSRVSPLELSNQPFPPKMAVVRDNRTRKPFFKSLADDKNSLVENSASFRSSDFHPSLSIETTDPPRALRIPADPVVKFGNMLDSCLSDEEIVKPKPQPPRKTESYNWSVGAASTSTTGTDDFHIPPASVSTVPELAEWVKEHPRRSLIEGTSSSGSHTSSSYLESQDTVKDVTPEVHSDGDAGSAPQVQQCQTEERSYLFPVSNSPLDIIIMLTRMASFTGVLLKVLTPNLRQNPFTMDDHKASHEYPSEVAMARQHAVQQLRLAADMKVEFLKKLHKAMLNSLKLYADNLLCMDLCCWSGGDAMRLLGAQMVYHLKRRKEAGEIWGCRHMVEARHGLHPSGIPCQRKSGPKFESITRDMCIRINNIHLLITIFAELETHLYVSTRTEVQKPISAFGYISSDQGELGSLLARQARQVHRPSLHRPRPQKDAVGLLIPSDGSSSQAKGTGQLSWPSSLGTGVEPDDDSRGRRETPEQGFCSRESLQVLAYLRNVQRFQLRFLCLRMNKFFKPALSLLLDLKLGDCTIEKRLYPLVTFLARHRSALQKYIYPECFGTIIEYLWEYIIEDLEEEAIKLRANKRPVTEKAHMLLQAVSHLIKFMHNQGNGLPLELLTSSSEYLLGLLDIIARSTSQLISIFNKLSGSQFARSRLDMSRAPVAIEMGILHALRAQLHRYKKCFSGKEFVDRFLEMGREAEMRRESSSTNTPVSHGDPPESSRLSSQVFSPTGQPCVYTVHYATEVAQYLLNERVLLPLPALSIGSGGGVLTPPLTDESGNHSLVNSLQHTSSARARVIDAIRPLRRSADIVSSGTPSIHHASPASNGWETDVPAEPMFSYSVRSFYKFADVEDVESNTLYQSQILTVSSSPTAVQQNVNRGDEHSEFHRARYGTLFLICDLLLQRARKEKRAKQFIHSPAAVAVFEQRKELNINCDQIFKL